MKGILFKPDMIKAIQEGRKTQTRRLSGLKEINQCPDVWQLTEWKYPMTPKFAKGAFLFQRVDDEGEVSYRVVKPRFHVGEVVFIQETWATENQYNHLKPFEIPHTAKIFYLLDGNYDPFRMGRVRSPMFMMEWMARDFVQITGVRAKRLLNITPEDCLAEGVSEHGEITLHPTAIGVPLIHAYANLWDSINPKYPWSMNPWNLRYDFKRVERP